MRNFFTKRHKRFWQKRKIDWRQAYFTPEHPHRQAILRKLGKISAGSVLEIGCGAGANLSLIKKTWPGVRVGGIDLSEEALKEARKNVLSDVLEQGSATDIFLSDKSSDVVLSDACLIYLDPLNINKALKEIKRVARNNIILVEFHSKSWIKRWMLRIAGGYNAYDYEKLLEKHGFRDIIIEKMTEWPDSLWEDWGYIIVAKV